VRRGGKSGTTRLQLCLQVVEVHGHRLHLPIEQHEVVGLGRDFLLHDVSLRLQMFLLLERRRKVCFLVTTQLE
jgi:hypothetical protein